MMNTRTLFWVRTLSVAAWLAVIVLFLFSPALLQRLRAPHTLHIMTWADLLDEDLIQQFTHETGIHVQVSYFESNDELYARLKATDGKGHDLIIPSDFMVQTLIADGLLKPLDRSKLTFINELDPRLLNLYCDPDNRYAIPYYWTVQGIGYNKNFFKSGDVTWATVFDAHLQRRSLVMNDSAREVVIRTLQYLFGSLDNLDQQKMQAVKKTLLRQKRYITAYTESRADYLLVTQEASLATTSSAFMWKIMKRYKNLDFVVPHEGIFVVVDHFAIPKYSKNEEYVYAFLNFLYRKEHIRTTFERHRFLPATRDLIVLLQEHDAAPSIIEAHSTEKTSWNFFKNVVPASLLEEIWIALKA